MNVYQKDGVWYVEVKIDSVSSTSRLATEDEIPQDDEKPAKKKADK